MLCLPTKSLARFVSMVFLYANEPVCQAIVTHLSHTHSLSLFLSRNPHRLQNMSLAVGPGTPAYTLFPFDFYDESEAANESSEADESYTNANVNESASDAMSEGGANGRNASSDNDDNPIAVHLQAGSSNNNNDLQANLDGSTNNVQKESASTQDTAILGMAREKALANVRRYFRNKRDLRASMQHAGCINHACWFDTPWRFSRGKQAGSMNHNTIVENSLECPTQIGTSGDDRLLKLWDCAAAMGSQNPLPGGWSTFCPYSTRTIPNDRDIANEWTAYYGKRVRDISIAGSITHLCSINTGHRGNVFHITPLRHHAGKVLTCGADGVLRMSDLVQGVSSMVVQPTASDGYNDVHSGMAFSQVLMTANTGLLCSEHGLYHFDVRLSTREQNSRSFLLGALGESWRSLACKACAVWAPGSWLDEKDLESTYAFAGGSSDTVGLYDLRMADGTNRIVQRYKPKGLTTMGARNVSVSGLDISKDHRELLVSYESDQIYTFPILQDAHQPSGATIDDIDSSCRYFSSSAGRFVDELASYGGHLNCFTFLKNGKYAGPNDEYICTGSDSGHAFIYERSSGTIVSLLGTDQSTCNGVLPHPELPFFITYGIDSDAKLWRASPPVDPKNDDSPAGRIRCTLERPYEMSKIAKEWDQVQAEVCRLNPTIGVLPDYIANSTEIVLGRTMLDFPEKRCKFGPDPPAVWNALLELPSVLRQNLIECCRQADLDPTEFPIAQPLIDFTHHVSLSRLRYQADQLGLPWNPWEPWVLCPGFASQHEVHPAEMVPNFPSDWINYDHELSQDYLAPRHHYGDEEIVGALIPGFFDKENDLKGKAPWLSPHFTLEFADELRQLSGAQSMYEYNCRKLLYETALLLKNAGNEAMTAGQLHSAARRYDKAINYCTVALMRYAEGSKTVEHLRKGYHETAGVKDVPSTFLVWSDMLLVLIMSRLNMALLFLKPEFSSPNWSVAQARAALKLLFSFTQQSGAVVSMSARGDTYAVVKEDEPVETYNVALSYQAKAYFRLGAAQMETKDYHSAMRNFEASHRSLLACPNAKPDALTLKRLQEAKRKYKVKKKRDRAKFQRALHSDDSDSDRDSTAESSFVIPGAGSKA
jgi:tetratricopeptide (TPR) repeat protein